jgi:hypothetical protein
MDRNVNVAGYDFEPDAVIERDEFNLFVWDFGYQVG